MNVLPRPKIAFAEEPSAELALRYRYTDGIEYPEVIRTFTDYADRVFGVVFTRGEGGIAITTDESLADGGYTLAFDGGEADIRVKDGTALSYALASLLLLMEKSENGVTLPKIGEWQDHPEGTWRGLMIDLARRWHPVKYLFDAVDLCWLYKINRLQLHFTDDQSYTLPCKAFPNLPSENRHYTYAELEALRDYAAQCHITLVPEVDMPGHCTQFIQKYPEVFGSHGIICAEDKAFDGLEAILREVAELFPDSPFIHLGGDEAAIARWNDCEGCRAYMAEHGLENVHATYAHFLQRVTDMVLAMGRTPVIWEGFSKEYNHLISKDVIVIAWESYYQLAPDLLEGGFTIFNCSWKPLYIVTPNTHWTPAEILNWNIYTWQHWWPNSIASKQEIVVPDTAPVLGGQICAWGDALGGFPSSEEACKTEFALIRERIPALAEKTWNVHSDITADELAAKYAHTDTVLTRILRG